MFVSPYKASKIVNDKLTEMGIEKKLPPQMFYTYTKKNYIRSTLIEGKTMISIESLDEWFNKYTKKHHNIATNNNEETNIDENQLALEI
jgi:hypothetical protein